MKIWIAFIFLLFSSYLNAAIVDTVTIYSAAMKKEHKSVVIVPDSYRNSKKQYPTVYLLHGYSGDYANWIKRVPALKQQSDLHQQIIVCPDGGYSSWYLDSPIDTSMKYETYIAVEVVNYIDKHYRTIKKREGRAITGLSMGGHGALLLAFNHSKTFGAAGSMSGGLDLMQSSVKFDLMKRIGDTLTFRDNWEKYSMISRIEKGSELPLAIMVDCGTSDFFFEVNRNFHLKMLELKIPHDYIERPGNHSWTYWSNAVEYQLLFFRKFFGE